MHITLYRGARGVRPVRRDDFEDWEELVYSLTDLTHCLPDCAEDAPPKTQKKSMLCIAPHRLRKGGTRCLADVEEVTLLVLDVDRCNLEVISDAIEDLETPAFLYTSPSDDPEGPEDERRVRLIFPVDRPITAEECKQSRLSMAEVLGLGPGAGVEGAVDAAKMFFIGRMHGTPEREVRWWS